MDFTQTCALYEEITHYDDLEDFKKEILPQLESQRGMWQRKVEEILASSNLSVRKLAELCSVTEATVRKWRNGSVPQNRDMFLRIGFAAGYDLEQMNAFLRRYGRCQELYIKSLEDSACIYILQSTSLPHTYSTYQDLLSRMETALSNADGASEDSSTTQLLKSFHEINSEDVFAAFVQDHAASYKAAYLKLYDYVITHLNLNRRSGDEKQISIQEIAEEQQWPASLRRCVSEIRSKRWMPLRNKIITLGLYLNMNTEEINELLDLAKMEGLCAKNPCEAALIFAVEDATCNIENPAFDHHLYQDGSTALLDHVRNILQQIELADAAFLAETL